MIARACSGSRSAISSVEPLMSANSAVTVLRSPSGTLVVSVASATLNAGAAARPLFVSDTGAARFSAANAVPQSPQNFLLSGFSAPHLGQEFPSGAPQSPQNFFPGALSELHLAHCIGTVSAARRSTRPA